MQKLTRIFWCLSSGCLCLDLSVPLESSEQHIGCQQRWMHAAGQTPCRLDLSDSTSLPPWQRPEIHRPLCSHESACAHVCHLYLLASFLAGLVAKSEILQSWHLPFCGN